MDDKDWTLREALEAAGMRGKARLDAYRRGVEHFQGRAFDAIEAHDYDHRDIRHTAPHLYGTVPPAGLLPRPTDPTRRPAPEKRALTAHEIDDAEQVTTS